jgi:conjugative relaxase-like TrwC/TraI family protein
MLSLKNVSAQRGRGYYGKEEGDRPSSAQWFGRGADRLDLSPEIELADFEKILEGTGRSGEPLSARKVDLETRRAATDFTFSAPKSVSIAALVQGDMRVIDAHDQAVRSVLTVMEEQYARTRISMDEGRIKVRTNNLVVGIFRHETSREQDPQLHSHALVMNCTQFGNGQWQSLSNDLMVNHSKFLGQVYQNELAHQLRKDGYEIKQRANGQFEINGYDELTGLFSTRRQQIEDHLAPIEHPTLKQREHAALTTRPSKVQVPSEVLSLQWAETLLTIDQPLPEIPKPSDPCGICEAARTDLSQTLAKAAIAYLEPRGNGFRSGAAEQYIVENFTGQTSFANLRNALKDEAVVMDELTGLMSQPAVTKEVESNDGAESSQEEANSLQALNEAIAMNFAIHEQLMKWHQAEAERKSKNLKAEELDTFAKVDKVDNDSSIEIEAAEPEEIIFEVIDVEPLIGGWVEGFVDEEKSQSPEGDKLAKDADFIAELTRVTVRYFRDNVRQGANVVENSDHRVAYHHNTTSGEPPRLIIEETATNTPIFETVRGADGWEAETVKLEAREWLEAANRELAEERRLEPERRKSQMEL